MKKNGFTLIEILISLAIIAALASISIPAIYNNVMKIEQASTVESAMNGLRQFFVDARAKSVKNEEAFELIIDPSTSYEDLESLEFKGKQTEESIYYTLPRGMRTNLTMDITSNDTTPDSTFTYLLGLFLKENTNYEIENNFQLTVKLANETVGTLSIDQGLPVLEF